MANAIRIVLMLFGIVVALFGIGLDFLLPGTTPGVNLPQLLIIFAGLAIIVVAYNLRRPGFSRRLKAGARRNVMAAALITGITLLALELLLTVFGISVYFERREKILKLRDGDATFCDEAGCRWDTEVVRKVCGEREYKGRHCVVNRQGYGDAKDFVAGADYADRTRVLTLGDSFTHGYSADVGKSFPETIEARLPEIVVWNAGFTTSGTNQAVASFAALAPILRPNLTILGFYWNDFTDNLMPIQSRYEVVDHRGRLVFLMPYRFDAWDNLVPIDEAAALHLANHGVYPPANNIERLLGSSRLGTLLLRLRDNIAEIGKDERRLAKGVELTRGYLMQLRDLTAAQDSALLIVIIPSTNELKTDDDRYEIAIDLMEELELPYMPLKPIMNLEEDYVPLDTHWSNAGHQKVGALLSDCIEFFIESGQLGGCELVVMP